MKLTFDAAPARIPVEAGWELSCPWHGLPLSVVLAQLATGHDAIPVEPQVLGR